MMNQKKTTFRLNFAHLSFLFILSTILIGVSSCGSTQSLLSNQEYNNYPGTIFLTSGEQKKGQIGMPSIESPTVLFISDKNGGVRENIEATQVDRIEYSLSGSGKIYVVRYMTIKGMFGKRSEKWVMNIAEGPNASAYVAALNYKINSDGTIGLEGTRQVMYGGNSSMVVNPSFPVYMMKKGEDALTHVALTKGVSFEDSAFRSGVSYFLSDDEKLIDHMHDEKWGFDNLPTIVENYIPNRGNAELTIDGMIIEPKKKSIFTSDFNKEMLFYVETALPSEDIYGQQFGIGLRTTLAKFFTYGVDLGYASAKYVDYVKRLENQGINNMDTAPLEERDMSKQGLFRVNASIGGQLPFKFKKVYLIPGAHLALGATLGSEYSAIYYGPMATFDIGFRMKRGNILMLGAGYRKNILLKGDEAKEEASAPGFKAYEPYNNLLLRLSYKF